MPASSADATQRNMEWLALSAAVRAACAVLIEVLAVVGRSDGRKWGLCQS